MNIQSAITQGAQILKDKFCLNPYLDSEILMSKVINKDKKYLILNSQEKLEEKNLKEENEKNLKAQSTTDVTEKKPKTSEKKPKKAPIKKKAKKVSKK